MSPKAKGIFGQVLHQLPTVAVLTFVFAVGGWKGSVDDRLDIDCNDIVLLRMTDSQHDIKDDLLSDRITELEAIIREKTLQIVGLTRNQDRILNHLDDMYQWMLEERQ